MSREHALSPYEALCRLFCVCWRLEVRPRVERASLERALLCALARHPFLRSRLSTDDGAPRAVECAAGEDGVPSESDLRAALDLHWEESLPPTPEAATALLEDRQRAFFAPEASPSATHSFWAASDEASDRTVLIAVLSHACLDAPSALRVASDVLEFLSRPPASLPASLAWASPSASSPCDVPPGGAPPYARFASGGFWSPGGLHAADPDGRRMRYRSRVARLSPSEASRVLSAASAHKATFQCVLWLSAALARLCLHEEALPRRLRFSTPARMAGRLRSESPEGAHSESLVCGAAAVYVERDLTAEDGVWATLTALRAELHGELESGEQLRDFLRVMQAGFAGLPGESFAASTLGVLPVRCEYECKSGSARRIVVEDLTFMAGSRALPGAKGVNVHAYTVEGLGTYLCSSSIEPSFAPDEAQRFIDSVARVQRWLGAAAGEDASLGDALAAARA